MFEKLFDKGNKKNKKTIFATAPTGKVLYRFQVLEDFYSKDFQSQYVKDAIYSVREGNLKLDAMVDAWIAASRVVRL